MSRFSQTSEVPMHGLLPNASRSQEAVHVRPTHNPPGTTHATLVSHCLQLLWSLPGKNWAQQGQALRALSLLAQIPKLCTHLEIAVGYSTMEFLQTLRRFFTIRGQPTLMITDNGTQLSKNYSVGADRELLEMIQG